MPRAQKRKAVILAGGCGRRVKHLLPAIPKPMASAMGRPFLEWVIRYLVRQGIEDITISTGYLAENISKYVAQMRLRGVEIHCSAEENALGTAGGFLNAIAGRTAPEDCWLVCNGDSLALAPLDPLYAALQRPGTHGAVLGLPLAEASRYGRLKEDAEGFLSHFIEKQPGQGMINAGIYLLSASLIARFSADRPLSFETDVFPELLRQGAKIKVCSFEAPFLDIGTEETLKQADEFIAANRAAF